MDGAPPISNIIWWIISLVSFPSCSSDFVVYNVMKAISRSWYPNVSIFAIMPPRILRPESGQCLWCWVPFYRSSYDEVQSWRGRLEHCGHYSIARLWCLRTNSSESVRWAQRLQALQSVPWVQSKVMLPERLPSRNKTVLLRNGNLGNSLPWILLRIPDLSSVFDGLIFEIFAKLDLEEVLSVVLAMKFLQPVRQNVIWVRIWLYSILIKILLCLWWWNKAVLDNIVTESVSSLRILTGRLHLTVSCHASSPRSEDFSSRCVLQTWSRAF